jgi:hypothetical protein
MSKLALFLAGVLLGLFFGRFYPLAHAPIPDPALSVHVPDNDEKFDLCDWGVVRMQPGPDSRRVRASRPWRSSELAKATF